MSDSRKAADESEAHLAKIATIICEEDNVRDLCAAIQKLAFSMNEGRWTRTEFRQLNKSYNGLLSVLASAVDMPSGSTDAINLLKELVNADRI